MAELEADVALLLGDALAVGDTLAVGVSDGAGFAAFCGELQAVNKLPAAISATTVRRP